MKALITLLTIIISASSFAGTSMHLEGSCRGTMADASKVSFKYYSNFDGCREKSVAAIAFSEGNYSDHGLLTGKRYFQGEKDIYAFPDNVRLESANPTGNTGGVLKVQSGERVRVRCEIRGYEYASEC